MTNQLHNDRIRWWLIEKKVVSAHDELEEEIHTEEMATKRDAEIHTESQYEGVRVLVPVHTYLFSNTLPKSPVMVHKLESCLIGGCEKKTYYDDG